MKKYFIEKNIEDARAGIKWASSDSERARAREQLAYWLKKLDELDKPERNDDYEELLDGIREEDLRAAVLDEPLA